MESRPEGRLSSFVSYDVEIATHERPSDEEIAAWAASESVNLVDGDVHTAAGEFLFQIDGPHPAESEDLDEALAAACLAPRWLISLRAPYGGPEPAIKLAVSLAHALAEAHDGAAYDPQVEDLIWPTRKRKRVSPRRKEERISVVSLEWLVTEERWPQAPAVLLAELRRRCPEALPTRFGFHEPLSAGPEGFEGFVLDQQEDLGFWRASRPCFGGSWSLQREHGVGKLDVDFDGRVLEQDARWRETVVELFTGVARGLGAFFAAAQVEPGWTVTANHRLYATAKTAGTEPLLSVAGWRGLPPVPVWLSWFGAPYRDLVAPHLNPDGFAGPRRGLLRRRAERPEVTLREHADGVLLRLGAEPRPAPRLGTWPLPDTLTYRHRPPYTRDLDGSIVSNPPQAEDAAETIPELRLRT